jgi:hypothetical protein
MIDVPSMAAVWSIIAIEAVKAGFKYTERLAVAGVEPSVGRVGGSYDNVLAETISDYTRPRSFTGARRGAFEATEFATLEWVDWFNDSSVTQTKRPLRRQIQSDNRQKSQVAQLELQVCAVQRRSASSGAICRSNIV